MRDLACRRRDQRLPPRRDRRRGRRGGAAHRRRARGGRRGPRLARRPPPRRRPRARPRDRRGRRARRRALRLPRHRPAGRLRGREPARLLRPSPSPSPAPASTTPTSSASTPAPSRSRRATRQLCIDGLAHGSRYQVTLRAGLPSAAGERLRASVGQEVYVRDRSPAVRFAGRAYVLPKSAEAAVPIVSVNAAEAALAALPRRHPQRRRGARQRRLRQPADRRRGGPACATRSASRSGRARASSPRSSTAT